MYTKEQMEAVAKQMFEAIEYTLRCSHGYEKGNYEVSFMYPASNKAYQQLLKAADNYKKINSIK